MAAAKTAGAKAGNKTKATDDASVSVAAAAPDAGPVAAKADIVKMKDFMARVSSALGGKKGNSREVVDATLTVLATALKAGESFSLPALGRGRVVKSAEGMTTLKLRHASGAKPAGKAEKEPLAATED